MKRNKKIGLLLSISSLSLLGVGFISSCSNEHKKINIEYNGFNIELYKGIDNTGTIKGMYEKTKDIKIPSTVEYDSKTYKITGISISSFEDYDIQSLVLPSNLVSIGEKAFKGTNLKEITLPNTVTNIGKKAFYNSTLTNITFSDNIENIGDEAFYQNKLTNVEIKGKIKNIGNHAFYKNDITELSIGNSIKNIQSFSFADNKLTKVTIGKSIKNIANNAFTGNSANIEVTILNNDLNVDKNAFDSTASISYNQ